MARLERETKRYITWFPYLIDSPRWTHRGWHIIEKERIAPRLKVLAPLSYIFPVLRVTYQRIVEGGMIHPDAFRLTSWMSPTDPGLLNDPHYAAWFAPVPSSPSEGEILGPPEPPGASSTEVDPLRGGPYSPMIVPTDIAVREAQQEDDSVST